MLAFLRSYRLFTSAVATLLIACVGAPLVGAACAGHHPPAHAAHAGASEQSHASEQAHHASQAGEGHHAEALPSCHEAPPPPCPHDPAQERPDGVSLFATCCVVAPDEGQVLTATAPTLPRVPAADAVVPLVATSVSALFMPGNVRHADAAPPGPDRPAWLLHQVLLT